MLPNETIMKINILLIVHYENKTHKYGNNKFLLLHIKMTPSTFRGFSDELQDFHIFILFTTV